MKPTTCKNIFALYRPDILAEKQYGSQQIPWLVWKSSIWKHAAQEKRDIELAKSCIFGALKTGNAMIDVSISEGRVKPKPSLVLNFVFVRNVFIFLWVSNSFKNTASKLGYGKCAEKQETSWKGQHTKNNWRTERTAKSHAKLKWKWTTLNSLIEIPVDVPETTRKSKCNF